MDDVFQNGSNDRYFYSSNFYNDYANIEIAKYCLPIIKSWKYGD